MSLEIYRFMGKVTDVSLFLSSNKLCLLSAILNTLLIYPVLKGLSNKKSSNFEELNLFVLPSGIAHNRIEKKWIGQGESIMKKKPEKLLDYLVQENHRWISGARLSDYLAVSTRQVRKYINAINMDGDHPIILSSKKGYKIDLDEYHKYITQHKNNIETPSMRIDYIIQKLILEKEGYNVFDLSEELYVSISTIENDLKQARHIINDYHLVLKRDKDLIRLEGDEKKKRNLMSWLISRDSYNHFVLKDEVRLLTFHYEFWDFRTTLRDIFTKNDIFVNDYTLNNVALHLIIMIDRIRNHCELEDDIDLKKIENLPQYTVALQIKDYIESEYHISVSDTEFYNAALVICNNTSMIDYSSITPLNINQFIDEKYIQIAHKVIRDVEKYYCLDPFDEDFISKFTIHIKNLFNRIENNYSATNPLTHKIKNSYPLIYDIAVFIAQEFKRDYQITLTEDEITFIAFHIGSYFEINVQSHSKVVCAFVYADYYSFHQNTMDKITKRFDNLITFKYAVPIDNLTRLNDVDLIISTIDIPFTQNTVIIHPFLTDQDMKNIENKANRIIREKKNKALKTYLMNFFDEKLFYKNPTFTNKDDALKILCSDLIKLDYTNESFYEDILMREKMSSTAFNNVAVPHVLTQSAKTSFVSIIISEEPLIWDTHKVYIVAMVGVHKDSRKVFSEIFESLIDILGEPLNIKDLIKSENFYDFIDKIKMLMDKNVEETR